MLLDQIIVSNIHTIGSRIYYEGVLENKSIVIAQSRIGKVASAITASVMIQKFHISKLIVAGVAGGAKSDIKIGDICIANECIQHDMDCSPLFEKFEIPLLGVKRFKIDDNFLKIAVSSIEILLENKSFEKQNDIFNSQFLVSNPNYHLGLLATGDQFINSNQKLYAINQYLPEVLFLDMEGASVAQVCFDFNIPVLNIRVISDNANNEASIDFNKFLNTYAKYATSEIVKIIIKDQKTLV